MTDLLEMLNGWCQYHPNERPVRRRNCDFCMLTLSQQGVHFLGPRSVPMVLPANGGKPE